MNTDTGLPKEFTGAADAIEALTAAVMRNVLCNAQHGLTEEQFNAIREAQHKAIVTLRVLKALDRL